MGIRELLALLTIYPYFLCPQQNLLPVVTALKEAASSPAQGCGLGGSKSMTVPQGPCMVVWYLDLGQLYGLQDTGRGGWNLGETQEDDL